MSGASGRSLASASAKGKWWRIRPLFLNKLHCLKKKRWVRLKMIILCLEHKWWKMKARHSDLSVRLAAVCEWRRSEKESTSSSFIFSAQPTCIYAIFTCNGRETPPVGCVNVNDHMEGYFSPTLETLAALFVGHSDTSQRVYISLFASLSANRKGSRPSHVYLVAAFSECLSCCRWNGRTMPEKLGAESHFCYDLKFIAWGWVFISSCFSLVQQLLIIFLGIKKNIFFSVSSGIN